MQVDLSVLSDVTLAWCDCRDENMDGVGEIAQFGCLAKTQGWLKTHIVRNV